MKKRIFYLLALIIFVMAVPVAQRLFKLSVSGYSSTSELLPFSDIQKIFPQAQRCEINSQPDQWSFVFDKNKNVVGKIVYTSPFVQEKGYAGEVHLLIAADIDGKIVSVRLDAHRETPDVVSWLTEKGFFRSWDGLTAQQALAKNVDAVTGATMTSEAIIKAFQKRMAMLEPRSTLINDPKENSFHSWKDLLALVIVVLSIGVFFQRRESRVWRNAFLCLNILVLGFLTAKMLSLSLFLGWIHKGVSFFDVSFVIALLCVACIFLTDRNVYCQMICPVGALQDLVAQLTKKKIVLPRRVFALFRWLGFIYFALIIGIFLTGITDRLELFEPFFVFVLNGVPALTAIIFGGFWVLSFFFGRLWCHFFCPTGKFMNSFLARQGKGIGKRAIVFLFCVLIFVAFAFILRSPAKPSTFAVPAPAAKVSVNFHLAQFFKTLAASVIQCELCPRQCTLKPGEVGFCRARKNIDGRLYALTYGQPVALHIDPIEKKPFAHVYPGTKSFSLATAGCNLRCKFCQNWEISQLDADKVSVANVSAQEIVAKAKEAGAQTIAFTYTEPAIFYEYMIDIAKEAKSQGIACVMHSAGYVNEKPLRALCKYLVAANIDLKGFNEKFYTTFTSGGLDVVLNTLKILREEGVWVEITNLLIPGANDSEEDLRKLCGWIKDNLGAQTPVHFSRFFPMYKLIDLSPTPVSSLERAYRIAKETGLQFVYVGNIPDHVAEDTACPGCGKVVIRRIGYEVMENNIASGRCPFCGYQVPGVWNEKK